MASVFNREALHEAEQFVEPFFREEVVDRDLVVCAPKTIYSPGPLHHPGRVPVQVIVDRAVCVLKILAFGEDVCRDDGVSALRWPWEPPSRRWH
jgi:hypothetical protein